GLAHPGGEFFKDTVTALLHNRQGQRLPSLIISPGMAGRRFAVLLPVAHPFTRSRPEGGRQTSEQFHDGGFQRSCALEALDDEQPQNHQGTIDPIVAANARLTQCLLEEGGGQKGFKKRNDAGNPKIVNDRREREYGSCLKPGYRPLKTISSKILHPVAPGTMQKRLLQKLCGIEVRASYTEGDFSDGNDSNLGRTAYATKAHGRLLPTNLDDVWKLMRETLCEIRLTAASIQPRTDPLSTKRAFHHERNALEAHICRLCITAMTLHANAQDAVVAPPHGPEGHKHGNTEDALF